jgi:hypothetical protein
VIMESRIVIMEIWLLEDVLPNPKDRRSRAAHGPGLSSVRFHKP